MNTPDSTPTPPVAHRIAHELIDYIDGMTWTWCKLSNFSFKDGWRPMSNASDVCPNCVFWAHSTTNPGFDPNARPATRSWRFESNRNASA